MSSTSTDFHPYFLAYPINKPREISPQSSLSAHPHVSIPHRHHFGKGNIVKFNLFTKTVYVVRGRKNIQKLLAHSPDLDSEGFVIQVMKGLFTLTPPDLAKYVNDKTGRLKTPNPGTETDTTTQEGGIRTKDPKRYWAETHGLYHDYLTRARDANCLSQRYYSLFEQRLLSSTTDTLGNQWSTIHIKRFIRTHLTECAVTTLVGSRMLELTPDFCERYWEFDRYGIMLIYMPPRWLPQARRAYGAQARCYEAVRRYLEAAWREFDWSDRDAVESDWEPCFGSRFARELARWLREGGFEMQSATGFFSSVIFGYVFFFSFFFFFTFPFFLSSYHCGRRWSFFPPFLSSRIPSQIGVPGMEQYADFHRNKTA